MPTIGHVVVGCAAARLAQPVPETASGLAVAMAGWSLLSLLPDTDVIAFSLGIPYHASFGHRGAGHSLTVALAVGILASAGARLLGYPALRNGLLAALVVASHGLLDTLTDGGLGIALLWPFSEARFFAPWTPIPVAPIGWGILSGYGLAVILWELFFFSPLFVYALLGFRKL